MTGTRRIDAKIAAREWILEAIQKLDSSLEKSAEREVRKFVARLQRDIKQLVNARRVAESGQKR